MKEFTKKKLMEVFEVARKEGAGIEVWVTHPELEDPEIIINSKNNLDYKKQYYNEAYTDDMRLKNNKDIRIVNASLLN